MSGIIGVPCNDAARYHFFTMSLTGLRWPLNTELHYSLGSDRIRGRNNIVTAGQKLGAEWVLMLDDDQSFGAELLTQLLWHEEPIVASLYLRRQPPFSPIAFSERDEDGTYRPLNLTDYPTDQGLVEVVAAGTGGMLVRMEVFRALVDQGLRKQGEWFCDGRASEDITFCEAAREAGFTVYVDLQARMGHCSTSVIWPSVTDDQWTVGAQIGGDFLAHFPLPEQSWPETTEVVVYEETDEGPVVVEKVERVVAEAK